MIPGGAGAQGLSTGGLAGTVKDTSGAVLPGVTVEATSPVLIEKVRSAVSDDRGEYKIVSLPQGTYVITFTLTGFSVIKREGIQLTSGFTAEVNAELRVGGLEETITVSGASPVVDVQNVVQQRVISRDVLDALPINKEFNGFAAITVGASIAATNQDVGGNQDPILGFISIHGTRPRDGRQLIDGLNFNGEGAGRGYYFNGASAQEVVMQTGAPPPEYELGSAQANLIPKDGGNIFSGSLFFNFTTAALVADNLTSELRSLGLTTANPTKWLYDVNGALVGPADQEQALVLSRRSVLGVQEQRARKLLQFDAGNVGLHAHFQ
jgi:hypothetical protein